MLNEKLFRTRLETWIATVNSVPGQRCADRGRKRGKRGFCIYRVRNNWQELVFNIYLFFPITLKVYIGDQCQDRPILNKKYKIHFSF